MWVYWRVFLPPNKADDAGLPAQVKKDNAVWRQKDRQESRKCQVEQLLFFGNQF
jgi:hypothetical protein